MEQRSVLLVDDDPSVLHMLQFVMKRAGFYVLPACSAEEALATWMVHKENIEAVIVDFELEGGRTGKQLLDRLTAERAGLKTILLSDYPLADRLGGRVDQRDILQKPYDIRSLIAAVKGRKPLKAA